MRPEEAPGRVCQGSPGGAGQGTSLACTTAHSHPHERMPAVASCGGQGLDAGNVGPVAVGDAQIMKGLQVHPELRPGVEGPAEAQGGVGGDRHLLADQPLDPGCGGLGSAWRGHRRSSSTAPGTPREGSRLDEREGWGRLWSSPQWSSVISPLSARKPRGHSTRQNMIRMDSAAEEGQNLNVMHHGCTTEGKERSWLLFDGYLAPAHFCEIDASPSSKGAAPEAAPFGLAVVAGTMSNRRDGHEIIRP